MRRIITVGREFGSGGREIGRRIAEELQIAYYDQKLLRKSQKRTALSGSIYPADRCLNPYAVTLGLIINE